MKSVNELKLIETESSIKSNHKARLICGIKQTKSNKFDLSLV